jgi:hypothetical protein
MMIMILYSEGGEGLDVFKVPSSQNLPEGTEEITKRVRTAGA